MIFISIHPIHMNRIINRTKNYEFRNYIPKGPFYKMYIYESSPICALKYVIELETIIAYPNPIPVNGIGNHEFNQGKYRYAYQIKHLYQLNEAIPLSILRGKFHFTPPQSYAYSDTYPSLEQYIEQVGYKLLY